MSRNESQRRAREFQQERERQRLEEERRKAEESDRAQALLPTLLQETKICQTCLQTFPTNNYGHLVVPFFTMHSSTCHRCDKPLSVEYSMDGRVNYGCPGHTGGSGPAWYGRSDKYCPTCREEQRKKNRQAYPLCPMCGTPTKVYDFLREYNGYKLDIIKVCCTTCIPRFEAMTEHEQRSWLRSAMVKTYGETAVIYALRYDACETCHHIGRTKHLTRRMAEYRRNWDKPIHSYYILEEVPYGPLSMERESRWILYALKHGWPIDNFDMFTSERFASRSPEPHMPNERLREMEENEQLEKARLLAAVANLEPLTAPFDQIAPIIRSGFMNTCDMLIAHWFYSI